MKWRYIFLSLLTLPLVAHAADQIPNGQLAFTPPATDISVILLSNIFGVVDGVLHGTSGQMLGTMLKVFNSAVLALGGIVVMYITMMGILNTANEGEFLGRKWSSIWIPIRSVLGVVLLLPKASGYCLMQIFIMWVVVQGVGAADATWNAALNYLERGGSIIQASLPTGEDNDTKFSSEFKPKVDNAGDLLQAQVCMRALQNRLEDNYKQNVKNGFYNDKHPDPGPVPNFPDSVDIAKALGQVGLPTQPDSFTVHFPDFTSGNYMQYNGLCGKMTWANFTKEQRDQINTNLGGADITARQQLIDDAVKARTLGVQQMYLDMGTAAQLMVDNYFKTDPTQRLTYGVLDPEDPERWISRNDKPALMQGTELNGAAQDYFAILRPTLTLLYQSIDSDQTNQNFFFNARRNGWIMAGTYFFDLVRINEAVKKMVTEDSSTVATTLPVGGEAEALKNAVKQGALTQQDLQTIREVSFGFEIAVANYAYIKQAKLMITRSESHIGVQVAKFNLPNIQLQGMQESDCTGHGWIGDGICQVIYNDVYVGAINAAIGAVQSGLQDAVNKFVSPIADTQKSFANMLSAQKDSQKWQGFITGNPIIALANLGHDFIGAAIILPFGVGVAILIVTVISLGFVGPFVIVMMPIITAVMGILFSVGALLAYYIPLIPYFIFFFGSLAWFISVIEAMVAAPLVALGVMHPEGQHELLGRAEPAFMILLNVFLRPSMMIIGYIAAFILVYIMIWLLNASFGYVMAGLAVGAEGFGSIFGSLAQYVMYVTVATLIVQKCFALIHIIPDKVLRFIGGYGETLGAEAAGMAEQVRGPIAGGAGQLGAAAAKSTEGAVDAGKKALEAQAGKAPLEMDKKNEGPDQVRVEPE